MAERKDTGVCIESDDKNDLLVNPRNSFQKRLIHLCKGLCENGKFVCNVVVVKK